MRHQSSGQPSPKTTGDWINELERDYFTRRARTPSSVTTWNSNYQEVFTHLPYDKPLTVEIFKTAIASTRPNTRMRQKPCLALDKLAFIPSFSNADIPLAAQQMGHSATIHSQTYHAWLTFQHHQQAFERLLKRADRPLPPRLD